MEWREGRGGRERVRRGRERGREEGRESDGGWIPLEVEREEPRAREGKGGM